MRRGLALRRIIPPDRSRRASWWPWLVAALVLVAPLRAQQDLSGDPGYVDLDSLGLDREQATLEIFLEGPLIRLVAEAVRREDSAFAELLLKLRAVRVQVFPFESGDVASVLRKGEETVRSLERRGWQPVFRVRDEEERIYLYLKQDAAGSIAGVWVMAAEQGDSVTLVNIVGDFDPVELGRLGSSLHIDPLEVLGRMAEEKGGAVRKNEKEKP